MTRRPELRVVTVHYISSYFDLSETQRRAIYRRADGTEFVVIRNREGKARRFTLDTPDTIFFTSLGRAS